MIEETEPTQASARSAPAAINRTVIFLTVALALMMMSISSTIVATALHALQQGLDAPISWVGWTITAYALGFVVMVPVSGRLSERYGHYRVFMVSVAVYTLASLGCGITGNIYELVTLRMVQAIGGAGFLPSATGIIVQHFGAQRDRAVGLFSSIFPIGAMIGPVIGGFLVMYLSWRAVFFVNVPLGALVVWLARRTIPRPRQRQLPIRAQADPVGIALLTTSLLAAMVAASWITGERAVVWRYPALLAVLAVAAGWLFIRHIHRSATPFIEPRLLMGRGGFGVVNLINAMVGGLVTSLITLAPLYATNRYGLDVLSSGTLLVAEGIATALLSVLATLALRRSGYRLPIYVGGLVMVAGLLLMALPPQGGVPPYWWLVGATFLVGVGSGILNPATRNAGLQLAPDRAPTVAALRAMVFDVGEIVGVSFATMALAVAQDPGLMQGWLYAAAACILLASGWCVRKVPEHRGAW